MFCFNCGKEIDDNANFCKYCGAEQNKIESEVDSLEEQNQPIEQINNTEIYSTEVTKSNEDEDIAYNTEFTISENIALIKDKIICSFNENKKLWYGILLTLPIIILFIFITLYISIINSYNSAKTLQESNQYEQAYKKFKYIHTFAPNYKDTKRRFDTCQFIHYYSIGTNSNLDDKAKEINLKKALKTKEAQNNAYLTQVTQGQIYNIWYKRAIIMAQSDYRQSKLNYAMKHIIEAENYLSLSKQKLISTNKQEQENLKIHFDSQEKYINYFKSKIKEQKNNILNLHSHMEYTKDDFEQTLQIYDKIIDDLNSKFEDSLYVDIVKYKRNAKPELYFMILHFGENIDVDKIIFNIDGKIHDLYVSKTNKVMDKQILGLNVEKYQISADEKLIQEIIKSTSAKIRLHGNDKHFDRTLSKTEIQAIKRTYNYYDLFARFGNIEERIKELKNSELFDRYVKTVLTSKYLEDKQIPNSEFLYTIRWDLFNLYKFQKLSPKQRIIEFEDKNVMYTISDQINGFVDTNQVYKIADNYCINTKKMDNGTYKYDNLQKVECSDNAIGIENLPYKKCKWFSREDKSGEYYVIYDIKGLWKEFDKKGINGIEKDIGIEIDNYFKTIGVNNTNSTNNDTTDSITIKDSNYHPNVSEELDLTPYMHELQKRIRKNWDPPKESKQRQVIILFKIAKDGKLLSCKVDKSSGVLKVDEAALKAVELTAPFKPLPEQFNGQSVDIQFTFDYNVYK